MWRCVRCRDSGAVLRVPFATILLDKRYSIAVDLCAVEIRDLLEHHGRCPFTTVLYCQANFSQLLWQCGRWKVSGASRNVPFTTALPGKLFPIALVVCEVQSLEHQGRHPLLQPWQASFYPLLLKSAIWRAWSTAEGAFATTFASQAFFVAMEVYKLKSREHHH
jgi:hypothetical protein